MDERFPAIKACAAILLSTAALLFLLVFSCCSGQNSDDIKQGANADTIIPGDDPTFETALFSSGTYINSVDVSNMTKDAVRTLLSPKLERAKSEYHIEIEFQQNDSSICIINGTDLTLKDDLEAVMSKALECGAGQYTTAIKPVDDIKLRNSIDSVAKIAEKTPVPAQILTHVSALRHPSTAVKSTVMPPSNKYAAVKPVSRCLCIRFYAPIKYPKCLSCGQAFQHLLPPVPYVPRIAFIISQRAHFLLTEALFPPGKPSRATILSECEAGKTVGCPQPHLQTEGLKHGRSTAVESAKSAQRCTMQFCAAILKSLQEAGTRARCVISAAGWMQH